jgi:integrase
MTKRKKAEAHNVRVSPNIVVRQTKAGRFIARVSNGASTSVVPIPEASTMQAAVALVEASGIIDAARAKHPQALAERYRRIATKEDAAMTNEFLIREYIREREFRGMAARTVAIDEHAIRGLIDTAESHLLASVTEDDVHSLINSHEAKTSLSIGTRGTKLNRIKLFYDWMVDAGYYHSANPCKNIRVIRAGTPQEKMITRPGRPFAQGEVDELVRRAKEDDGYPWWFRFVVLVAAETGLRRGDCYKLDWASYQPSENALVVVTGKTGAMTRFHITDNLRYAIGLALDFHREVTGETAPPKSGPMLKSWSSRTGLTFFWFRKLGDGIIEKGDRRSMHSFRRSAAIKEQATKMAQLFGGSPEMAQIILKAANEAAQKKLGHSSVSMTEHYLKQ